MDSLPSEVVQALERKIGESVQNAVANEFQNQVRGLLLTREARQMAVCATFEAPLPENQRIPCLDIRENPVHPALEKTPPRAGGKRATYSRVSRKPFQRKIESCFEPPTAYLTKELAFQDHHQSRITTAVGHIQREFPFTQEYILHYLKWFSSNGRRSKESKSRKNEKARFRRQDIRLNFVRDQRILEEEQLDHQREEIYRAEMEISEESAIPAPSSESHEEKMEAESSTGNVNGEQQEHEVDASPEEHEEANPEEHEANPEEQEEHDTLKNQSVVLVENSLIIGRAECYGRMNQGPSEAVVVHQTSISQGEREFLGVE